MLRLTAAQIQMLVETANQTGLKWFGRQVVAEPGGDGRTILLRDEEHSSIAIRVPVQRVQSALASREHWVALPRRDA